MGGLRRGATAAVATAMVLVMVASGLAVADEARTDGDGLTPVSAQALAFGTVCAGSTTTKDILFALERTTNGNPNTFKSGTSPTVTVLGTTGAGLSASFPSGSAIALPSDWSTSAIGTVSPAVTSTVQVVAGSAGAFSGSVTYLASGINVNNGAITREAVLPVTATVVTCDTTPPTLHLPASPLVAEATGAGGAAVGYTATATDADPAAPAVTCSPGSGATFPLGTTTVDCSAADAAGNTTVGSFTVRVDDTTPPALSGTPTDIAVEATAASGATVTYPAPTAADLVDGPVVVGCVPPSGSTVALGSLLVLCSATDSHGNTGTSSFTIIVQDTTGPVLALPDPVTEEASGPSGADVVFAAIASDVVDGAVAVTCDPDPGSTFPLGDTTVDCSATDSHANTSPGSFTVTVEDTTAPALTLADETAEATGPAGAAVSFGASAQDLVDGPVGVSCDAISGGTFAIGTTLVTCSATDAAGNTAGGSFSVTVEDTAAPVLALPADITLEATGAGTAVSFAVTANDVVDGSLTPVCTPTSGTAFPVGVTEVACDVTDAHGNTAMGSFFVTIEDTTAPTLVVPGTTAEEATSAGGATVTFDATATDLVDGDVAVSCVPASGATFPLGETVVDCGASDAAGNLASDSFSVVVVDTTPPALSDTPSDLATEASGPDGAVVTYTLPAASDIVDGLVEVDCQPPSGATFAVDARTTVSCTAVDAKGNEATSSFTVLVSDTRGPLLSLPGDMTPEATGPSGAVATYSPTASDTVDGPVPVSCEPPSGTTFAVDALTTVTCSASDAHLNESSGTFTVMVLDTTTPTLTLPADITAEATGPTGAGVGFATSAADLVDGSVAVVCDAASGDTFPIGPTAVSCSAADAHGNTEEGTFLVTVVDTTAPTLTLPADITVEATGPSGAAVLYTATAHDLVDGVVAVNCAPVSGSTLGFGTTTVDCSTADNRGNGTTGSFAVTVVDTTAPDLTVPPDITAEATGPFGSSVDYTPTASDIVDGGVAVTCDPSSGSTFALGSTTVDCSATDAAGNTSTSSFAVNVEDTTEPSIASTPTDVVQEAASASGAVVTYTDPTAGDIVDGDVPVTCAPPSGSEFALDATTTVTCEATDDAGNTASSSFTVEVHDTTAPALSLPADITAEATGPTGAAVGFSPSAFDAVDGSVGVTCAPPSGSTFAIEATTVGCSATDVHDNTSAGSFIVTVVDTTAPVLALPAPTPVEATGASGAAVSFAASAHDLVDGSVAVTCDADSGDTFPMGATTVSCQASDTRGNAWGGSFVITVVDTTAPALTLPADIATIATSAAGATTSFSATAVDVVDGPVPVVCTPASGSTFAAGTTTVACSALDAHANVGIGSFTVTVTFDLSGGFLQPVTPNGVNVVRGGSIVPLRWQVRTPYGGWISSLAIIQGLSLTQVDCATMATASGDPVDVTATGGTWLRYAGNQYTQNWQTPRRPGMCMRVDVTFVGGQRLSALFGLT